MYAQCVIIYICIQQLKPANNAMERILDYKVINSMHKTHPKKQGRAID